MSSNIITMTGKFEPKVPVNLEPPKTEPISLDDLAKANGIDGAKCYVAIKVCQTHGISDPLKIVTDDWTQGKVYDVTGNKAYQPGGSYNVFAGKDASKALGKTSTKPEDVSPDWRDLTDKEKETLNDWVTFFSKRYNVVGVVEGATNME
ncbi:putative steroid-binding protein 3 [Paramyrothecium foliicola]|nr:putative steroid-binding protein 3 [Paramyrothecium foliicola]